MLILGKVRLSKGKKSTTESEPPQGLEIEKKVVRK